MFKNIFRWFKRNYVWFIAGAFSIFIVWCLVLAFDYSSKEGPRSTIYDPPVITVYKGEVVTTRFCREAELYEVEIKNVYENYPGLEDQVVFAFASTEVIHSMEQRVAYFILKRTGIGRSGDLGAVAVHNHTAERKIANGEWELKK